MTSIKQDDYLKYLKITYPEFKVHSYGNNVQLVGTNADVLNFRFDIETNELERICYKKSLTERGNGNLLYVREKQGYSLPYVSIKNVCDMSDDLKSILYFEKAKIEAPDYIPDKDEMEER